MSATNQFRITQIVDNGRVVQITLVEDVSTEPISQQQMIIDSVSNRLDPDTKEQVMPILEAIMSAQPKVNIKTYQQTQITIAMPRSRYDSIKCPQVGDTIEIKLRSV